MRYSDQLTIEMTYPAVLFCQNRIFDFLFQGHEFTDSNSNESQFCEQCCQSVWSKSDSVTCQNCFIFLHKKCVSSISRRCNGSGGAYIMKICPEEGLHAQKYRCKDCRCRIALNPNQSGSVFFKKAIPVKVAKLCRPVKTKKSIWKCSSSIMLLYW